MKLLFLGDINVIQRYELNTASMFLKGMKPPIYIFANLEGSILSKNEIARVNRSLVLLNSEDVLDVLRVFNVDGVCLANNHMYDLDIPAKHTADLLKSVGIASFGAGNNLEEASQPLVVSTGTTTAKIFSFGWGVIGCRLAGINREGVNPLTPEHLFTTIRQLRRRDKTSFVIFIMHWNYELERYPQPAHRQLAHDLVKEGVDAIIGLHPHVVQGAELVHGKPIVYSIGNWFFPPRKLGHFHLVYPPVSNRELAFELQVEGRQTKTVQFHWYQFDPKAKTLEYEASERWHGSILKGLTPYSDLSHRDYIQWFKKNRARRSGLPIYKDYHHKNRNHIKDVFVKMRQRIIKKIVELRLKRKIGE